MGEVLQTHKINWARLITNFCRRIDSLMSDYHQFELCHKEPIEVDELDIQLDNLSPELLSVCVYVAGFFCHKFSYLPAVVKENIPEDDSFYRAIQDLDRGRLKHPQSSVVSFVVNCHHLFNLLPSNLKQCRNYIIQSFELLDDLTSTNINEETVYRTLANIFIKNFCHSKDSVRHQLSKIIMSKTGVKLNKISL